MAPFSAAAKAALVLSVMLAAASLGCSRHSGPGLQERFPGRKRAVSERRSPTSAAAGRCPVRFFRSCELGVLSREPAVLHTEAGLVADCGRLFDLATGEYLGALKTPGHLLTLISEAQALFEVRDGLRLSHPLGTAIAEDPSDTIVDWALSRDRSQLATIEIKEPGASQRLIPAPEVPLAATMDAELVVRRLPSLKRIAAWRLRPGTLAIGRSGMSFVDDHHVAYLDQPDQVTSRALDSGAVENWPIPGEPSEARLSSSARALLVERNDRRLALFGLPRLRPLGEAPGSDESIRHGVVSGSLAWLLTATESALQIYRRTPSGFELQGTLRSTESPLPAVDGDCAAVTLDDGVLVTGLEAPLLGGPRLDALLDLPKTPGSIFARVPPESPDFGGRARFRAADDDRAELMIEALPKNLLARALGGGQDWSRSAVEYAVRAEPSAWLGPERLHAAWTTPEGGRAVEFRVGLRPGETCADYQRYVRVQETAQALLLAQVNVPLGAEPERTEQLLEAGFDELLGPIPAGRKRPADTDELRPCP